MSKHFFIQIILILHCISLNAQKYTIYHKGSEEHPFGIVVYDDDIVKWEMPPRYDKIFAENGYEWFYGVLGMKCYRINAYTKETVDLEYDFYYLVHGSGYGTITFHTRVNNIPQEIILSNDGSVLCRIKSSNGEIWKSNNNYIVISRFKNSKMNFEFHKWDGYRIRKKSFAKLRSHTLLYNGHLIFYNENNFSFTSNLNTEGIISFIIENDYNKSLASFSMALNSRDKQIVRMAKKNIKNINKIKQQENKKKSVSKF